MFYGNKDNNYNAAQRLFCSNMQLIHCCNDFKEELGWRHCFLNEIFVRGWGGKGFRWHSIKVDTT